MRPRASHGPTGLWVLLLRLSARGGNLSGRAAFGRLWIIGPSEAGQELEVMEDQPSIRDAADRDPGRLSGFKLSPRPGGVMAGGAQTIICLASQGRLPVGT